MSETLQVNVHMHGLINRYRNNHFEFDEVLTSPQDYADMAWVWGQTQDGYDTPKILLVALDEGHWDTTETSRLDDLVVAALQDYPYDQWPVFAHLIDKSNNNERLFSLFGTRGTHSVDEIPPVTLLRDYQRLDVDPTYRWSMETYTNLMHGLDAFHEQVYQTVKDKVDGKNDIIEEVAKLLFLESFRLHHDKDLTFSYQGQQLTFRSVFDHQYVKELDKEAVAQIQAAFEEFKNHPGYVVIDDQGNRNPIFDRHTHLRLEQPRNYVSLLETIQQLGPVTDNYGKPVPSKVPGMNQGTLADMAGDLLGRVFDVFLRANFESKGGLGIYLTPNPVKQAMLEIAFHDILNDPKAVEELTARDANGEPVFKYGDPTCGSFGFGSVALRHMRMALEQLSLSDTAREKLWQDMLNHSFIGADAAPRMVMLARVNMALQGANQARIFYTGNSLTSQLLQPNSLSLICTNPPFGTPKFKSDKRGKEAKTKYEENMEQVLGGFRPVEQVVESYNAWYDHTTMRWEDTGDLELDEEGNPIWAGYRTDLRNISSTNRPRYAYFPSTSGLALGSKPNRNGEWKQVKGGSIDPAVLFIDRCLQLLKPGGRLLIVLPDGILCNSGDRYVREYIMGKKDEESGQFVGGKAIVKAVISLPSDTFKLSGTGAKTSILYLQKRPADPENPERFLPEPQGDVFMAVAETLGYLVKNNVEDYSAGVANDLDKIVGAYKRGE